MCLKFKSFENNVGKGEIACNEQFLLFPQCFLSLWRTFLRSKNIKFVICNLFNFGRVQNLPLGMQVKLQENFHITFSNNILLHYHTVLRFNYFDEERFENNVGKGENAGNQHFLLFLHVFLFFQSQKA